VFQAASARVFIRARSRDIPITAHLRTPGSLKGAAISPDGSSDPQIRGIRTDFIRIRSIYSVNEIWDEMASFLKFRSADFRFVRRSLIIVSSSDTMICTRVADETELSAALPHPLHPLLGAKSAAGLLKVDQTRGRSAVVKYLLPRYFRARPESINVS